MSFLLGKSVSRAPRGRHFYHTSDVEQELDHVAILYDVLLALGALQALGLDSGIIEVVGFQVAIADDAGADEAALEVAVDLTGSLRSLGALADGPGAALLFAVGQEGDEAQQVVAGRPLASMPISARNAVFSSGR